jgi:hypothetical protein
MKNKLLSIGAVVLLALLTPVWAADILGNWIAHVLPMSSVGSEPIRLFSQAIGETVFSFKVRGTKLTGTVSDPQGETAISEGKIDGDKIFFVVVHSFSGNKMKLVYKGKVALNEIRFTREVQGGTGQPQDFTAKREFQRNGDIPVPKKVMPEEPSPRERIIILPNK